MESFYTSQFSPENAKHGGAGAGDHFIVEELLDFPNDEGMLGADTTTTAGGGGGGSSTESSSATALDTSCNSYFSAGSTHDTQFAAHNFACPFSGEFAVPYDDMAELEWLSNFVEESFPIEDLQKMQLISGLTARNVESPEPHRFQPEPNPNSDTPTFRPEMAVPAKARSKRSRAAACNWTSRLLVVSPSTTPVTSSSSESDILSSGKKAVKIAQDKKDAPSIAVAAGEVRRCLHCATDKTPQWRTGPMGPKTLCNACGVRFKSGRLVPEYRPAASPTFTLTKHSNSHRKVLEIRRQKEIVQTQHQQQFFHQMFDASNGDDYLIHQHIGPHFRQLI